MQNKINKIVYSAILYSLIIIPIFFLYTHSEFNGKYYDNIGANYIFYFSIIIMSLIFSVIFFRHVEFDKKICLYCFIVFIFYVILFFIKHFAVRGFILQIRIYILDINPYFVTLFILSLIVLLKSKFQLSFPIKVTIIILLLLVNFISIYVPNPFSQCDSNENQIIHYSAYTNTIFNAFSDIPISNINQSIYGRYAIFYKVISLIFGKSFQVIIWSLVFFTLISYLLIYLFILDTIKNNKIFVFTILAINIYLVFNWKDLYLADMPHRLLFFSITLCFCHFFNKINSKKFFVIGILIQSLSLLWSVEFGFCSSLYFIIYYFITKYFSKYKLISLANILDFFKKKFFLGVVYYFAIVLIALILLNIYNISLGGQFQSIIDLIYPFFSKIMKVKDTTIPFYSYSYAKTYMYILIICVYCIYFVISIFQLFYSRRSNYCCEYICLAIYTICATLYYINRAHYENLQPSFIPFILLTALFLQNFNSFFSELYYKKIFKSALVLILLIFTTSNICATPFNIWERVTYAIDTKSLEEQLDIIKKEVPRDTPAFGIGTEILYRVLGWNKYFYVTDFCWWDFNDTVKEFMNKEISNLNQFFAYEESANLLDGISNYDVKRVVRINHLNYNLYTKK